MMDRAVAMSDAEAVSGGDRIADPDLGMANRGDEILAPGEPGGDGRGQRASGAMGVAGGAARRRQGERAGVADEVNDAVATAAMAALDQHRGTPQRQQPPALGFDFGGAGGDRRVQQR